MAATGTRIVHSYSRRDRLLRLIVVGVAFVAVIAAVALAGIFTLRLTRAQPEVEPPEPSRVVKVNVAPGR